MNKETFKLSSSTLKNLVNVSTYNNSLDNVIYDIFDYEGDQPLYDIDRYISYLYCDNLFINNLFELVKSELPKKINFNSDNLNFDCDSVFNFDIEFKPIKIVSPKSYNYSSDSLYIDVTFDIDVMNNLITSDEGYTKFEKVFNEHLENTYFDRPGYWNFMPSNIDEFVKSDDMERKVSAFINFLLESIEFEKLTTDHFANLMLVNYSMSDFISETNYNNLNNEINRLKDIDKKVIEHFRNGGKLSEFEFDVETFLNDFTIINNVDAIEQRIIDTFHELNTNGQFKLQFTS